VLQANHHADFYVAVAAALPVLFIVIAFQTRLYHDMFETGRRMEPWIDKWSTVFLVVSIALGAGVLSAPGWKFYVRATPYIFILLPLSSIGVACGALMFASDALWLRVWAASGLGAVLLLAAVAALVLAKVTRADSAT